MPINIETIYGKLIPKKIISPPKITLAMWATAIEKYMQAVIVSKVFLSI